MRLRLVKLYTDISKTALRRKNPSLSKVMREAYDNILNRNPRFLAYFSTDSKFLNETLENLYSNIERTSEGFQYKIKISEERICRFYI